MSRARRSGARSAERSPRRRRGGSELGARVLISLPLIVFAIFIVSSGGAVFAVAVIVLGLLCLHELFQMYARVRPVRLAGFLGLIGLALAAALGDVDQVLLVAVATFPLAFLLGLAAPEREGLRLTGALSLTLLGTFWIGLAVAHAILLRELPHGDGLVVDVLVGTFLGDTGAYLGGRSFGTRRLAPRVSPNKTWEGLAVGALTAVVATWAAGLYQDWLSHGEALLLGLAVAVAAPLGDLFESKVKRDAGAKDTSGALGAHGGVLDRLDAALFTLVAGYWVARALA